MLKLSIEEAALLCYRVGGLVNALRLSSSKGGPQGGPPQGPHGREQRLCGGAPKGPQRGQKGAAEPLGASASLDVQEAAAAVAAAVEQRRGGPELLHAFVPFLWVLGGEGFFD